ncbi:MAG TPA: hypothetical protein VMI56_00350 [Reyranella sp.]|nr:hypothetical protein [Reyranella sp.]
MIKKFLQAALVVAGSLALGGCPEMAQTAAPTKAPPAPNYQSASATPIPPAANIRAICYNDTDLNVIRSRMLHQELVVATLQCQSPSGARAFDAIFGSYLNKFQPELTTNARSLQQLAGRKRFNVDTLVTEFSNRMAQHAPVDKDFCSRSLRAIEWALDAKASSLALVPPPYDLGPEMNIYPCPAK